MTLTQRLLLLGLLSLLPVILAVLYLQYELRNERESEARQLVARQAQQANVEMSRLAKGMEALLLAVASAPSVRALDRASCSDYLSAIGKKMSNLAGIGVLDLDGNLRCTSREIPGALNYADRDYFKDVLQTRHFVVGRYTQSRVRAGARLPFAAPVQDLDGELAGVVVATLDLDSLNAELQRWPLGKGSAITIADRDGVIIARNPLPERFVGTRIPDEYQPWVRAASPGTDEAQSQDGTWRIISYVPATMDPIGLYVSTGVSRAEIFADVDRTTRISLIIMVAGIAVTMLSIYVTARFFVRQPVDELLDLAEGWTAQPPRPPRTIRADGEFGEIAAALNRMGEVFSSQRARELEHQAHQKTLIRELNHRFKNTLMIVQSIVTQALRGSGTDPEVQAKIEGRLLALSSSHDLLTRENWTGSLLQDVAHQALEPFGISGDRARSFSLLGEAVHLTPRLTLSLGMAFHELATNATKYGALSSEAGRVTIAWRVAGSNIRRRLHIRWQEEDGPPVVTPARKGFGSRLIERWLGPQLEGRATLSFAPTGVVCDIEILLPQEDAATPVEPLAA
jgi:two-component sensor histidine kinase